MKLPHLFIALAILILAASGCKKSHITTGRVVIYATVSDSTVYNIVSGELNVDASGSYSTVAYSANQTIDIAILGQLLSGPNTFGSNYPTITVTTNPGSSSAAYTYNTGGVILQGSTATFVVSLQGTISSGPYALMTGTINF